MTQRVCFLFNHEDVHQVAHSLPVAQALAAQRPDVHVEVAVSSAGQEAAVGQIIGHNPSGARILVTRLGLSPVMDAAASALSRIVPARRVAILARHLDYLKSFDVLVVPEFTSTLLKSRWRLDRPKLVCIPHGSGDRSVGFSDELRLFDLILVAGDKTRQRMIDRHPMMADRIKSCGYPKFDTLDLNRKPRLFENDRPVVVYNPHFDPRLSSWYRFGQDVLRYFAEQDRYNLVFAPHVMLFRKPLHGSMEHRELRWRGTVPAEFCAMPHMLIDTGSARSVDMTYTLAGDIYLGDVSSQIYEWIIRPRPAIFLNSHAANWAKDPNYAHWHLGPVLDDLEALPTALAAASAPGDHFQKAQAVARDANFAQSDKSASHRCALELSQILI